jgi:hypothetical protein
VDNLLAALAPHNPHEAWYIGAPSEYYFRVLDLGGFHYGAARLLQPPHDRGACPAPAAAAPALHARARSCSDPLLANLQ